METVIAMILEQLVVDANPLIAALMEGKAKRLLRELGCTFYATQHTLFEVRRYLPKVVELLGRPEPLIEETYRKLPVTDCQPRVYEAHELAATNLIATRMMFPWSHYHWQWGSLSGATTKIFKASRVFKSIRPRTCGSSLSERETRLVTACVAPSPAATYSE